MSVLLSSSDLGLGEKCGVGTCRQWRRHGMGRNGVFLAERCAHGLPALLREEQVHGHMRIRCDYASNRQGVHAKTERHGGRPMHAYKASLVGHHHSKAACSYGAAKVGGVGSGLGTAPRGAPLDETISPGPSLKSWTRRLALLCIYYIIYSISYII